MPSYTARSLAEGAARTAGHQEQPSRGARDLRGPRMTDSPRSKNPITNKDTQGQRCQIYSFNNHLQSSHQVQKTDRL